MINMNGEMLTLIDNTVKKAVAETVAEMKRQNLVTKGVQTPFQKTETLLFNRNNFLAAIKDKEEMIEEIKKFGLSRKSTSITSFSGNGGFVETKTDEEKADEKIEGLMHSIQTTRTFLRVMDEALETVKDDMYYELIPMRYFEGATLEDIAEYFDCDVSTVSRNKNRLINILQIRLFSDEVIKMIFAC